MWTFYLFMLLGQVAPGPITSPESATPEYGHGLSAEDAKAGWINLFDGETSYGWEGATVGDGALSGGQTASPFSSFKIRGEVATPGEMSLNGQPQIFQGGPFDGTVANAQAKPVKLGAGISLKSLQLLPVSLKPIFNGRDLSGWTVRQHPNLAADRQTKWTVEEGVLHAVGGPGGVESNAQYGDLVLRVEVRMRAKLVNGGLFFRSVPGQFMNGYEAQVYNGCYGEDPARPARYSTGAIDDRLLARRLVSRDLEPFTMTVIAVGPHIATWVNGYQTVDWIDKREKHANPREGLRLEPGTIQLQAHDPETDIEFRKVEIAEIK